MHREDGKGDDASAAMVSKSFLQPGRVRPRRDMLNGSRKMRKQFDAFGTYSAALVGLSLCNRPATARTLRGAACQTESADSPLTTMAMAKASV